jgi:hypothetical protein
VCLLAGMSLQLRPLVSWRVLSDKISSSVQSGAVQGPNCSKNSFVACVSNSRCLFAFGTKTHCTEDVIAIGHNSHQYEAVLCSVIQAFSKHVISTISIVVPLVLLPPFPQPFLFLLLSQPVKSQECSHLCPDNQGRIPPAQ